MQIIVHAEYLKLPVVFSKVCLAQTIFSFICSVLYIIVCSLSLFALVYQEYQVIIWNV
jgi:hypothetical protein